MRKELENPRMVLHMTSNASVGDFVAQIVRLPGIKEKFRGLAVCLTDGVFAKSLTLHNKQGVIILTLSFYF